jgi:hypothetical protein
MPQPLTLHCNFSCVLQIDAILSPLSDPKFSCNATIQSSPSTIVDGIKYRDTMSIKVEYYNVFGESFPEEAMIFCIGSLCVTEGDSTDPLLTLRSHCLIRFGMVLLYYHIYIIMLTTSALLEIPPTLHTRIPYLPRSTPFSAL